MTETIEMPKLRLQVTVREDLVKWIDQQIDKARFGSRSHAIEYALTQLKEQSDEQDPGKERRYRLLKEKK